MGKATPRSVTPFLSFLRNFLLGRSHTTPLRFGDYYAPRTQPPPDLPLGPHTKLADNYYCSHDVRRNILPPEVIALQNEQLKIGERSEKGVKNTTSPTPGGLYNWD